MIENPLKRYKRSINRAKVFKQTRYAFLKVANDFCQFSKSGYDVLTTVKKSIVEKISFCL